MAVPYSFATQTGSIPLSQLDSNFATAITLGNTAVVLGNTYSTIGNLTLSNVTISSGNVSINVSNVSTLNVVTLTVTGNETVGGNVTITGNVSVNVANVTTLNATSSTITGNETVGGNVTVTGNVSVNNATFSNSLTLSGGTANGVAYLNGSKVLTTGSALTFNGSQLAIGTTSFGTSGGPVVIYGASSNQGIALQTGSVGGGFISNNGSGAGLNFYTNTGALGSETFTERMRIDASGNVGIGATPPAWGSPLSGYTTTYGAYGAVGQSSNGSIQLIENAYYNGTNWIYRNTGDNALRYVQGAGNHTWYTAPVGTAGNAVTFTQSLAVGKGTTLALEGASSASGTGIAFPATQSASSDANTLDDYEEGTWTPTVNGVNLGAVGRYTKVGRLVSISFSNQSGITGIAVNANMNCSGIPFNVVGGVWDNAATALMIWNNQSTGYPDELACGRLSNSSIVSMTNKGSETTTTLDPWGLSVVYYTS